MPFCGFCGTQVDDAARFCPACGRELAGADDSPGRAIDRGAVVSGIEVARRRSQATTALLTIAGLVAFLSVVSTLFEIRLLNGFRVGRGTFAEAEANDARQAAIAIVELLVMIGTGIAWLMWQHRAQRNLQALGARTRFTPGWAVGWWFIPFANLWMPYLTVRELYTTSLPEVDGSRARSAPILGWWWVAYLLGGFLAFAQGGVSPDPSLDELIVTSWVSTIGSLFQLGATVLAILVVRDIVRGQATLARAFADVAA